MAPRQVILTLARLAIGAVFLIAGAMKIPDPAGFARAIANYRLTGPELSFAIALYLPWLEVLAGAAILCRRWHLGALAAAGGMSLVFTLALLSARARGLDIACGCFGNTGEANGTGFPLALARDLLLVAGCGVLLASGLRKGTG